MIEPAKGNPKCIKAIYDGKKYEITNIKPRDYRYPDYYYPNLALLSINLDDHPCVFLYSKVTTGDELYVYGYEGNRLGGEAATVEYEGPARYNDRQWLLKFKEGQIIPGYSGSPLVDLNTGGVCGVVKKTRDKYLDRGGVPKEVILEEFPELSGLQERYHRKNSSWSKAREELEKRQGSDLYQPPQPIVNVKPAEVSLHFKDRYDELSKFRKYLGDPQKKMICIVGDAGVGKTEILSIIREEIARGTEAC